MTPLGHASVAYLAGRATPWFSLTALVVGGVLPDMDFIFYPFPFFNQIHRVATHNIFFVTFVALAGAMLVKRDKKKIFWSLLAGGLLHVFVDSIRDDNATNGLGVAIFWPLSDYMFCPFNLTTVDPANRGWGHVRINLDKILDIVLYEGVFWLSAAWLILRAYLSRTRKKDPAAIV